jgi:periplasmic divalent cation tolerance protein
VEQAFVQVATTVDSEAAARDMAKAAVAARLAACAQIGRVQSIYWWVGDVTDAEEWTVTFKTTGSRYTALEEHIRAQHPYEVPEILATAIVAGDPAYLAWIRAETNAI